jgi:uncharacterized membrane protein YadS
MMKGSDAHRLGTLVLSLAMAAIGAVLLVEALISAGGGAIARLLLGILFLAAGAGRIYAQTRGTRGG